MHNIFSLLVSELEETNATVALEGLIVVLNLSFNLNLGTLHPGTKYNTSSGLGT
jgi:hypothetical protein